MAGFGDDGIAIVTGGLIRDTGSFAERMVSSGYIGDIVTAPSAPTVPGIRGLFSRIFGRLGRI